MRQFFTILSFLIVALTTSAQSFINGSFENSTTTVNIINMNNATYTATMNNSSAFGTFGNMDIITTCTWGCPTYGSWFVSLTGNGTDAISLELNQNLVSGNTYTFTFYDRKHQSYQCTPIQIGVSTSATAFGTLVWTASASAVNSTWTQRTVTFVAPNNGSYITVKQSGGTTGYWVHVDNFEFQSFLPNVESEYLCYGDYTQFSIDTTGFDSVYWDFGDTLSGSSNYSNLEAPTHQFTDTGTYTVQLVTYADSNIDTVFHTLFIYPRQWADLGNDTSVCVGSEITLSVDQPFAEYEWSTGSTDSTITVTSDSIVMVTVNGICDTVSDTIHINWMLPFDLDLGNDTNMCTYDTDTIDPGLSSNLAYSWNVGGNQPTKVVNDTGIYTVTVSDGVCTYSDSIHYGYYPEVIVDLGNDSSFCYTNLAEITPYIQNVSSYQWSTGAVSSTIQVGISNTYSLTVYGVGNHCMAEDEVHWDFWHEPVVDLGNDTSFCHTDVLTLNPYTQSAFPMSYRWNNNSTDTTLGVNLVGLYWVEVSDENCSIKDTILIDQYPILEVDLGEDISACEGDQVQLKPIGSQQLSNFVWNTGETTSTVKVSGHGTYSVTVDNGLCQASDEINVFIFEYPNVDLGNDTSICPTDELTFDVTIQTEIMSYRWNDNTRNPVKVVDVRDAGDIWVQVTNQICTSTDSIRITTRNVEPIGLINDTAICQGTELILQINPSYDSVLWNNGMQYNHLIVQDSGGYSAMSFDGFCNGYDSVHISYRPVPSNDDLSFDELPNEICLGETFYVDKSNDLITAYEWQDGSTSPNYVIEDEGLYWVKGYHRCGVLMDSILIERCECPVWIPNSFNPNGNGRNDQFMIQADCDFNVFKFQVFNRWGEIVFETDSPEHIWDGTYRGVEAPGGAYGWMLEYSTNDQRSLKKEQLSGQVLLLR